jgi:hypothetical protein
MTIEKRVPKYGIEINTDSSGYSAKVGWDSLYGTHAEALAACERAMQHFPAARVFEIEAPEHVDHLYRNLADKNDKTYLYK